MAVVEVVRVFPHPPEEVFRLYTDHEGWTDWAGTGRVWLERTGLGRVGVGAVRAFTIAPGLREEVVAFDPPRRMDYRIVAGPPLLADHHGEVHFEPFHGSTRVTWRVSFRERVPFSGFVLARVLEQVFHRILAALGRELDRRARKAA
jgi:uncharacterized protein YndB with AHSA1/START domain